METPIQCRCKESYLEIQNDREGWHRSVYCPTCGLMYSLRVIIDLLVCDHHYTTNVHGQLNEKE